MNTDNTPAIIKTLDLTFAPSINEIRVHVDDQGETWWVAKDVCEAIGIIWKGSQTLIGLESDESGLTGLIDSLGRERNTIIVSESGLYTLILRSDAVIKPGTPANKFKKWVTREVIPSVRKTGSYGEAPKVEITDHPLVAIAVTFRDAGFEGKTLVDLCKTAISAPAKPPVPPPAPENSMGKLLASFITELAVQSPGAKTTIRIIRDLFAAWLHSQGIETALSVQAMGKALNAINVPITKTPQGIPIVRGYTFSA